MSTRAALGDISNGHAVPAATGLVAEKQYAVDVRVTRLAAARQRMLAQQQHKQQKQPVHPEVMPHTPVAMSVDYDIDEGETNPQRCKHYAKDIYLYLRERETKFRVHPFYMQSQRDINATMRGILVDWLVEVAEEYRLESETLHLTVNYIDRFLGYVPVARSKLQLVGVSCMLLAAKYEEIHPPGVDEFVYISDNTYTRAEILAMEGTILNRLQFELSVATPKVFLNRFIKAAQIGGVCDPRAASLCHYLCELTLQEYAFLKYSPSMLAAASLRLALHAAGLPAWTATLEATSGYSAEVLNECVSDVLLVYRKAESNSLQAVREKYSHAKFLRVSLLSPPVEAP